MVPFHFICDFTVTFIGVAGKIRESVEPHGSGRAAVGRERHVPATIERQRHRLFNLLDQLVVLDPQLTARGNRRTGYGMIGNLLCVE